MLGEAEPEREDDAVAALGHRFLEAEDGERLGGVAADEVGHVGPSGEGGADGGADALGVLPRRGDDHQRLRRPVHRVLDHEGDYAGHLGVGALDGAADRVGCARAALDVVDAEAPATEVRARPRERDDLAAVEGVVDERGEVFSPGAVAAGEGLDGEQLREAHEHALLVERLVRRVGVVGRNGGRHPEGRGLLRHRVAEHDELTAAAQSGCRLGEAERPGIRDDDDVEAQGVGNERHVVGRGEPHRSEGARERGSCLEELLGADVARLQGASERRSLVGLVDDADAPLRRQL